MKVYTGTSWTLKNQETCAKLDIGMMSSPVDLVHPDKIIHSVDVSLDNSAFRCYREGRLFNESNFYNWLNTIKRKVDFVAIPDIVCGGIKSYEFSLKHIDKITLPKYFVVQDGMTFDLVYNALSKCDGCFIGGSTVIGKCAGWKWRMATHWIKNCHDIGLKVHMGRCPGNLIGLSTADKIGIDSIDVSTLIRHQQLERVPIYRNHLLEQQSLVL